MSLSDKTRKILWGRSGNRCTICKNELIVDSTGQDDESVIADECHIISSKPNGPRHDPSYPADKLDSYDNMILLCRTHHKMIDDQSVTYTTNILRQMKLNHEVWVSQKLTENQKIHVVGGGKGNLAMTKAINDILGTQIAKGIINVYREQADIGHIGNIELHPGDHLLLILRGDMPADRTPHRRSGL